MLCIASFIILAVLSLFSVKYRPLVKESLDCVLKRVTLRPCDTGFDIKVRSAIVAGLMTKSPRLAKFFNRRFEFISWIFVAAFFLSLFWSGRGLYLYWSTGSCNGLNQSGFCVLDPAGANNEISSTGIECKSGKAPTDQLSISDVDLSLFPTFPGQTDKELVFIGCYACEYTKKAYPMIKELIDKYRPNVTFVHYPSRPEAEYLMAYDTAILKLKPDVYFEWLDRLYQTPREELVNEEKMRQAAINLGLKAEALDQTVQDPETQRQVLIMKTEIDKTGIYGTPTVFIDGKPVVGPKPYRVYRMMLKGSWF